jgi:hypothetical protein
MKNLEELWGRIASVTKDEVVIAVLKDEIVNAESLLQPHDTGHLHDYIARLNNRLEELDPYAG